MSICDSTAFYTEVYSLYAHSTYIPCGMTPAHSTLAFSDSNVESGALWKSNICKDAVSD